MKFIFILKIILFNISFVKIIILGPKKKLIPKIKCTMFLEQLYYMYYNTRPKSAPKGVIIVYFHPCFKPCSDILFGQGFVG